MTEVEKNITIDLISRYEQRKRLCFKFPNPYYKKGEFPTEYQDLKIKISELQKLIKP